MPLQLLLTHADRLRFGVFEAIPGTGILLRKNKIVPLQDQPFRLLCLLLEKPGEIVTREEVRAALWPGVGYGAFDESINTAIRKLRLALQDSADAPRIVETLPKRGFRFIAAVKRLNLDGDAAATGPARSADAGLPESGFNADINRPAEVGTGDLGPSIRLDSRHLARRSMDRWYLLGKKAGLVAGGCGGILGLWFFLRPVPPAPARIRALAVLPLVDLSHREDQAYLSQGLTGELITRLAKRPELKVIDLRTALNYRNSSKPSHEIASELGVDGIVEGTLQRSGDQVRVQAHLVSGRTQQTIWADTYTVPMGELLEMQDQLAGAIVKSIELQAHATTGPARPRVSAEAMEAYLRGNHSANLRDTRVAETATAELEKAIRLSPDFAEAHAGLADHYFFCGAFSTGFKPGTGAGQVFFSKARIAANKALALDPDLAKAHCAKATILLWLDWDWAGAERASNRALVLDPGNPAAWCMHAWSLLIQGHVDRAVQEARRGRDLDPLSVDANGVYAAMLMFSGSFDEGLKAVDAALKLEPGNEYLLGWRSRLLMDLGNWQESVDVEAYLHRSQPQKVEALRKAFADGGESGFLVWLAKDGHSNGNHLWEAVDQMKLGRKREALDALEMAYEKRDPALPLIGSITAFKPLRDEGRFKALLQHMKLA